MENVAQYNGPLNQAQMSVLRLLGRMKTVGEVEELRQVILDYYARKIDDGMEKLWESGEWNDEKIDQILKTDFHKQKQPCYATV